MRDVIGVCISIKRSLKYFTNLASTDNVNLRNIMFLNDAFCLFFSITEKRCTINVWQTLRDSQLGKRHDTGLTKHNILFLTVNRELGVKHVYVNAAGKKAQYYERQRDGGGDAFPKMIKCNSFNLSPNRAFYRNIRNPR